MKVLFRLFSLFFVSFPAFATLTPDYPRGESLVAHDVAVGRRSEYCIIPKHFPGGKYSKKDVSKEQELCDWNIGENIAACPKDNSTNPGVDFYSAPEGVSIQQLQAKNCDIPKAKKQAKLKFSTSCSYSPALLAYYHMSRVLGDAGNVPVAVMRTLDLARHKSIAKKALDVLGSNPSELIYKTWSSLSKALNAGASGRNPDLLFTDDYDQTYGALQFNPKGEVFYKEFFNGGSDRVAAFREKNPIYRALINTNTEVSRSFTQANVQKMVQLKDASEMILLDTILGQQDRFGNIHADIKYYYQVDEDGILKVKSKGDKEDIPEDMREKAVPVKEMILKDNDCGVSKENRIKAGHLLDKVAHLSPSTYKRLMEFEKIVDQNEVKRMFTRGLFFTESDYRTVSGNIHEAARMLKAACQSGRLKLDLDIDKHFSKEALPATYDCL